LLLIAFASAESFVPSHLSFGGKSLLQKMSDQQNQHEADQSEASLTVGFIGCGTIAAAIATGLASQSSVSIDSICVSRRSESKSSALAAQYPNLVTVHDENQDIVDRCDLIFVCVLPQQTSEIMQSLQFDSKRHTVVSLVSTSTLAGLADDTSLPPQQIYKCICLPAVSKQEGICLVTPKSSDGKLLPLFESLGGVIEATDEAQMSAMMVPSALMGSLYGMMKQSRDWLLKNTGSDGNAGAMSKSDASYLVGRMFWGMMQDAERRCREDDAFEELIAEQTPGGLNEQALRNWSDMGALDDLDLVQDALLDRITGKGDGSIDSEGR
jgi:pyrroline-5-carboxylate reductase